MEGGKKFFISIDFEARGPSMVEHGVNAVGWAVFDERGDIQEKQEYQIIAGPSQKVDKVTKEEFWDRHPDILAYIEKLPRTNTWYAGKLFVDTYQKYRQLGSVTWIAYPAAADWNRLKHCVDTYANGLTTYPDIGHKAVCISTMADSLRDCTWMEEKPDVAYFKIPYEGLPHTPLADAIAQGQLYFRLKDTLNILRPVARKMRVHTDLEI